MKSIINIIIIITASIHIGSCAFSKEIKLATGAESVRVVKSDPPDNYKSIGTITGIDGGGCGYYGYFGEYNNAVKDLQNKAFKMGGTYARIITIRKSYKSGRCDTNLYKINATVFVKEKYLPSPTPVIQIQDELTSKLRRLDNLHEQSLITDKEYHDLRTKLINQELSL